MFALAVHVLTKGRPSICAVSTNKRVDSLGKHKYVQPGGPVTYVKLVKEHTIAITHLISPGGLPKSGNAGFDHRVESHGLAVMTDLLVDDGPGADEAHFAAENVPDLGQFVEAGLTQEGAQ